MVKIYIICEIFSFCTAFLYLRHEYTIAAIFCITYPNIMLTANSTANISIG